MKIGNNGNLVLGPFDESTPCLMIVWMNCQTKLRINHLTAVKSVAILESNANLNFYTWKKNTLYYEDNVYDNPAEGHRKSIGPTAYSQSSQGKVLSAKERKGKIEKNESLISADDYQEQKREVQHPLSWSPSPPPLRHAPRDHPV
ncbi:alpha-2 adrenergic receptor [Trichonephila clavipes]|nr:alpha-2 adrenergic receptor [Trichonephila clavipes]